VKKSLVNILLMQLREFYNSLTPVKRMSIIGSVVVLLTAVMTIALMAGKKDYAVLLKDVNPEQVTSVVHVLENKKIAYQLVDSGKTILVPKNFLASSQMIIMSEIGSDNLGQGLELFDKQNFGTTNYEQRIRYQRALQGELVRSINTIDSISRSKVILAIPEKKTFMEEGGQPTASVVVELYPGKILSEEQVRGITFLVANAVENMKAENVSVVDSRGKVLSKKSDSSLAESGELMDARKKIENYFQERVESILSRVVGDGKVIARVSAELNNKQTSFVEETVDPEKTAVKSTDSEQESVEGNRSNPSRAAGATSNLPGGEGNQQSVSFNQDIKKEHKVVNYEVPKTVRNVTESAGSVNRLSIAVLVDGIVTPVKGKDGKIENKWAPRDAEEVKRFEAIVKNAIGFDEKRGDTVKIESFQFAQEDFSSVDQISSEMYRQKMIRFILSWVLAALGLVLIYLFVIRPFTSWVTDSFQESMEDMLPKTIEELEELQSVDNRLPGMNAALPVLETPADPEKAETEVLKDRIMNIMQEDGEKAGGAFSLWLVRRDV
jgi:flagellar M-ring protein FliF